MSNWSQQQSIYYCNSSYDPAGSVKVINSPNCNLISSMTETNLNNKILTEKNSSYSKGTYAITNGLFGGIKATAEFYIEYETLESNPGSSYEIKYANGSTVTNIGFNETNVTAFGFAGISFGFKKTFLIIEL